MQGRVPSILLMLPTWPTCGNCCMYSINTALNVSSMHTKIFGVAFAVGAARLPGYAVPLLTPDAPSGRYGLEGTSGNGRGAGARFTGSTHEEHAK